MTENMADLILNLASKDDIIRKSAFDQLMSETEHTVDWFDEAFPILADKLESNNSFQRNIGVMLICNLAKSDRLGKTALIAKKCLALMDDEKFITTRMAAQSIWKIAVAQLAIRPIIKDGLMNALRCSHLNPHPNLIRLDIINSLLQIHAVDNACVDLADIVDYVTLNCEGTERKRLLSLVSPVH